MTVVNLLLDIAPTLLQIERMNRPVPELPSVPFADKRRRQAAWNADCERKQLSVEERNRAASIFPRGARIKVLAWPSL